MVADPSGSWEPSTAEAYIDQKVADINTVVTEEVITRQTVDSNLQTQINAEVYNRNAIDSGQDTRLGSLEAAYRSLTESDVIVGARPSSGQQANVIYREPDQGHTPPQFYCDYMWYNNAWVLMAQYDNGIDNNPLPNSNNLVKSSGVFKNMGAFDISAYNNGTAYADFSAALAAVPATMQAGGMNVKFLQIIPAQYRVVKTEGLTTQPSGTALSTDPNIVSGTYTAEQLSSFASLPSTLNSSLTYYLTVSGTTTTYTSWVITYVQTSNNKYVQYRLMSDAFNTTESDWQGVDDEPTIGSHNLVESGSIANELYGKQETELVPTGRIDQAYTLNGKIVKKSNVSSTLFLMYYQNQSNNPITVHIKTTNSGTSIKVGEIFVVDSVLDLENNYIIQNSISSPVNQYEISEATFVLEGSKLAVLSCYYNNPYFFNEVTYFKKLEILENKVEDHDIVIKSLNTKFPENVITFVKNGKNLVVTSNDFKITASLDKNEGNYYRGNHIFNFLAIEYTPLQEVRENIDEAAPAHVIGTTIGANHGVVVGRATIANHGLTNRDLGTSWTHTDGKIYYPVRIVNENTILFMSDNYGTTSNQLYYYISAGTITNSNRTLTITSADTTQLWPIVHNITQDIIVDNKKITIDGEYQCNKVDVIEEYEVADPASILSNIKTNVGTDEDPTFEGDPLFKVKSIYRFVEGGSVVCFNDFIACKELALLNIMFAQSSVGAPGEGRETFKYYIPNSNPINGYDFRKPLLVDFSQSVPSLFTTTEYMADPTKPVNRIVTYGTNFGFALGFLPVSGVGKNLNAFTNQTFEIRNTSGKIYPHGVDTRIGDSIMPNEVFSAVMYRGIINTAMSGIGNRMSFYTIPVNDSLYVFIDYKGTVVDDIQINQSLNGKIIQIVESRNTSLLTDIYNNGFFVKADYIQNDTCFIVLKIG